MPIERKRPQARKKRITESNKEAKRRGKGQGTGPVGVDREDSQDDKGVVDGLLNLLGDGTTPSGQSVSGQSSSSNSSSGMGSLLGGLLGGGSSSSSNSGGGFKMNKLLIILLIVVLLGGGGGLSGLFGNLFGGLLGGGGSSGGVDFGINENALQTITQNAQDSTSWQEETVEQTVDETVANGTRAKYTKLKGNNKDVVTMMIYMCGTDLESRSGMATRDLVEMTKASLSDNINIIVYTGGCKKWQNQNISNSTNQIYKVVEGGLQPLEQNLGSKAMTDPATLTSFIQYCTTNFPANRNQLILWDHGGGSVQGYGYDEKYKSSGSMSLAGINTALKNAGTKFDFIGFDACLMATLETGLMLEDYADYMIASEETEPGIGWYYTDWLTVFSRNTSISTVELGKNIVDDFVTTCARSCRGQSATLSVVDLAELANTTPASLKSFSKSLTKMIESKQYSQISDARNSTREFARSTAIDQIDLIHFAKNMGNKEGQNLASSLSGAIKYNRTSSDMTNSYGISIFFPYRSARSVDSAVSTYNAIGMDSSYAECIREFASLEVCGQAASGGYDISSLLGLLGGGMTEAPSGSSSGGGDMIGSLLGGFLGGDYSSILGLSGGKNTAFITERSMSQEDTLTYIQENYFDKENLKWTEENGKLVMKLPEDQWNLVEGLEVNMFYDDGEGYIDLGLDNTFEFDDDGNLVAETDHTWIAVNGQPVAYYHDYTVSEGDEYIISGHIPALLNGERVNLLVLFDDQDPYGTIVGANTVYTEEETQTVAKNIESLEKGDQIDFLCDYYTYDGEYTDSYFIGDPWIYDGTVEISNVKVGSGDVRLTYRFTDIYQQHYWTAPVDFSGEKEETAVVEEETPETAAVVEDGEYTSRDDLVSYISEFGHLPSNFITKNEARELGWDNSLGNLWDVAPGKSIGGDRFGNYEGSLPSGTRYTECDVNYEGGYRGAERIIFGKDGSIYYTDDHYETFTKMK